MTTADREGTAGRVEASATGRNGLEGVAVFLYLFGVYTGIHLLFHEVVLVPYIICGLLAPYFTFRALPVLSRKHVSSIFALGIVTVVGIALAPGAMSYLGERVKGLTYLLYSLWISYTVFLLLRSWHANRTARLFGWIVVILVGASALESYVPGVRDVSDAFRQMVYRPQYLYDADVRDIRLFGAIRPKVFAEEPSYLAFFLVLSVYLWFSLTSSRRRYVLFALAVSVGMFFIRSPVILIAVPLAILTEFFCRSSTRRLTSVDREETSRGRRTGKKLIFALVGVAIIGALTATVLETRLRRIETAKDLSTFSRVVAPVFVGLRVLKTYPVWGVGITGHEVMADQVTTVFARFGARVEDPTRMVNAFWLFVVYYGIMGGALFGLALWRLMRHLGARHRLYCVACIIGFTQSMGAFVGMRMWFTAFAVFLVSCLNSMPGPGAATSGAGVASGITTVPTA